MADPATAAFTGTFRHVGYVVANLDAAMARFGALFGCATDDFDVIPPAGVATPTRFAFVEVGGCVFELIEPLAEPFLSQLRPGTGPEAIRIDHVAFTVADLAGEVSRLAAEGVAPAHVTPDGPVQMPSQRMCYFGAASADGFLLELVEPGDASEPTRRW